MDKILIVDDERNVHYSFRRVLGTSRRMYSDGRDTVPAASGVAAAE